MDAYKMRDRTGSSRGFMPVGHHERAMLLVGHGQETGSGEQNRVGLEI